MGRCIRQPRNEARARLPALQCPLSSRILGSLLSLWFTQFQVSDNCEELAQEREAEQAASAAQLPSVTRISRDPPGSVESPSKYLHSRLHILRLWLQVKFAFQVPRSLKHPLYLPGNGEANHQASLTGL